MLFTRALISKLIIPLAICGAAAWWIADFAIDYRKSPGERMRETKGDPLKKEKVFPFRKSVLKNPGPYIELPDDIKAQVDEQIRKTAASGQQVLCCDYDSDKLQRSCTGYVMWKDAVPIPLEDLVDVHPKNPMAYLGNVALPHCPATKQEAWRIIGMVPGRGWSPSNISTKGYPKGLREKVIVDGEW